MSDLRIVLIGRSGNGKSSSGNTILFEEGKGQYFGEATESRSFTRFSDKISLDVRGRNLTVVDTPGTQHSEMKEYDITKEIYSTVEQSDEGFDVFLVTFSYTSDGLSTEERKSLKQLENIFTQDFFNHVIFLFTHGDYFEKKQKDRLKTGKQPLGFISQITRDTYSINKEEAVGPIMRKANDRILLFCNTAEDPKEKIKMSDDLVKMIDELKVKNNNRRYSKRNLPQLPKQRVLYKPWTWF